MAQGSLFHGLPKQPLNISVTVMIRPIGRKALKTVTEPECCFMSILCKQSQGRVLIAGERWASRRHVGAACSKLQAFYAIIGKLQRFGGCSMRHLLRCQL